MSPVDPDTIRQLPKALLHEHLDGGLRVSTILELADESGYADLPASTEADLASWFHQGKSGSLERYLEAFEHTVAVMQTQESIKRIAAEAVEDLADDGVVYAEIRFAPSLNTRRGLTVTEVLEAAHDGFSTASRSRDIVIGVIVTAMRQGTDSAQIATTAVRSRHLGVVGFDLAGPEAGFPPTAHVQACRIAREGGLGVTVHAGEGDGPHSIWQALNVCAADRIGHGVRVADDTDFDGGRITHPGSFASTVRDRQVPLEVAVSSNIHTATYPEVANHPLGALYRAGFNVSINTDNRLMSGVTLSDEYTLASSEFGFSVTDLRDVTVNAIEAGFLDYPTRRRIIDEVVIPRYGEAVQTDDRVSGVFG